MEEKGRIASPGYWQTDQRGWLVAYFENNGHRKECQVSGTPNCRGGPQWRGGCECECVYKREEGWISGSVRLCACSGLLTSLSRPKSGAGPPLTQLSAGLLDPHPHLNMQPEGLLISTELHHSPPCHVFSSQQQHTAYVWTNTSKVDRNSERTISQSESSDSPTLLPFPRSFPVTWNTVSMFIGKKLTAQVVKWIVFSATHTPACSWPLCEGSQTESYEGKALLFCPAYYVFQSWQSNIA